MRKLKHAVFIVPLRSTHQISLIPNQISTTSLSCRRISEQPHLYSLSSPRWHRPTSNLRIQKVLQIPISPCQSIPKTTLHHFPEIRTPPNRRLTRPCTLLRFSASTLQQRPPTSTPALHHSKLRVQQSRWQFLPLLQLGNPLPVVAGLPLAKLLLLFADLPSANLLLPLVNLRLTTTTKPPTVIERPPSNSTRSTGATRSTKHVRCTAWFLTHTGPKGQSSWVGRRRGLERWTTQCRTLPTLKR